MTPANEPVQLRRFDQGASQEAKAQFASELIFALNAIGVRPGSPFMVCLREHLDALEQAVDKEKDKWRDKVDDAEREAAEGAHKGKLYDDLMDMLEDVPRGIRSLEEVMDEAYRSGPE